MAVAMPEGLVFDANGLVPVVAQDRASGDVLMVAWTNAEAMAKTAETGFAHFWSRSRKALWRKGETSGHELRVVEARADCDRDTFLLVVEPDGPGLPHRRAHLLRRDLADRGGDAGGAGARRGRQRAQAPSEESYTARLLAKGPDQVLKKIGEEATEVVLAARGESDERLAEESADLLFHLLVALHQRGLPLARVMDELRRRRERDTRAGGATDEGVVATRSTSGCPRAGGRCLSFASCRATCARRCRPSCPSPRAPSGPSCSRASSAASGWRATRSSAATPSRGSRCGTARSSCTTPSGTREEKDGLLGRAAGAARLAPRRDPRPAALHRRGRRLPHLGRGAALRAASRPPRRGQGDRGLLRLLRLARGLRPRAPAARPHRAGRARQPRGLRPRAAGPRRLRGGPRLGAPALRDPPVGAAAGPPAHGRRRLPRRRPRRQGAHRRAATSSRWSSRASTPSTAASTRSPSTARCAW